MASIPSTPRGRFGWVMYDWSAQPFFTIILTFIFGPYFVNAVAANPQEGQTLWANAQTFAGLAMALTAPFLGAYADESGPRKPWVIGFSLLCIFSCLTVHLQVRGEAQMFKAFRDGTVQPKRFP